MNVERTDLFEKKIGPAIRQRLYQHGQIKLTANGQSMFPFIREGDICSFSSLNEESDLKKGSIVLYQSDSGRLIAHRLIGKADNREKSLYWLIKGDSNIFADPPVYPGQLLGILTDIRLNRHRVRLSHIFNPVWTALILNLPRLSWCVHKYLGLRRRAALKFGVSLKKT